MQTRVLIISLGSIGKRHLRNTRTLLPEAEIGVFRQSTQTFDLPEGADRAFTSFQEAVDFDPNAVIVASPASKHAQMAVPFLHLNKPLFLEKPLEVSCQSAQELLKASQKSNSFSMVGYVCRFLPVFSKIREILAEERLGKVLTAHAQVGQYLPDWRPNTDYRNGVSAQKALGGGALLELSHELDYTRWLFGSPHSILCSKAKLSDLEIDVEDSAHVIYEYEKKRVFIQLDFLQRMARMALQIVGAKATLHADLISETITLSLPEGNIQDVPFVASKDGNEPYLRQFDLFFSKAISQYTCRFPETKNFKDWASIPDAFAVLKLVELSKASSDEGQRKPVGGPS